MSVTIYRYSVLSIFTASAYFILFPQRLEKKLKKNSDFTVWASQLSSNTDSDSANHGTPIAISVIATFVVTTAAVAFLTAVLILVLCSCSKKRT